MKTNLERSEWLDLKCENGRRGRQDIIMNILLIAKCGSKKTNLIEKVRLSSAQCNKYLMNLEKADYVTQESGVWKTTEKGLQVIEACRLCHNLMNPKYRANARSHA